MGNYHLYARCPVCNWIQFYEIDDWGWTTCRNPYCSDREWHHYHLIDPDTSAEINPEKCLNYGCPYCANVAEVIRSAPDDEDPTPPTSEG